MSYIDNYGLQKSVGSISEGLKAIAQAIANRPPAYNVVINITSPAADADEIAAKVKKALMSVEAKRARTSKPLY